MCITDIVNQLVFMTIGWIIKAAILLRVKLIRSVLFVRAVWNFVLFVLIGDVCHVENAGSPI
jgi:hypothetical protein